MTRPSGTLATATILLLLSLAGASWAQSTASPSSAPQASSEPTVSANGVATPSGDPTAITGILGPDGIPESVGLNEKLQVQVRGATPGANLKVHASQYVLFFNSKEVKDLPAATYDRSTHALVFVLRRTPGNKDLWTDLLGSPSLLHPNVRVKVALGERPEAATEAAQPSIEGSDDSDTLNLQVFGPVRLAVAALVISGMIWLVLARARQNTTLRDGMIPQIAPSLQTYSLARCQMTFWFVLIFCAFIFLYIATWDYNTVSPQALILMGISGATALAAVGVDAAKDSPADAINRGLQALGFNSYADVERLKTDEIPIRQSDLILNQKLLATLPPVPPEASDGELTPQQRRWQAVNQRVSQLIIEINDRNNRLSTYEDRIRPFLTQGFFSDITTDINGTTVHRLQVVCWTLVLGAVFIIGVYRNLAMPEFSDTLLTLMGISGAGYVGFKYQEKNN